MEIIAKTNYIRISPRKLRLVTDGIRPGYPANRIFLLLANVDKRAGEIVKQTLKQAISNAKTNYSQKEEDLKIKNIQVNEGPISKRFKAVSRGMAHKINKRTSHLIIVLEGKNGAKS